MDGPVIEYDLNDYTGFVYGAQTYRWIENGKVVSEMTVGKGAPHASDCALHNEPALPAGPCDCGDAFDLPSRERLAEYFRKQKPVF